MLVTTKYGEVDDSLMLRREKVVNGVQVVEYYFHGELVHRSAAVEIKGLQVTGSTKL